jgi:hypothetical protein
MAIKTVVVLVIGLAFVLVRFAEAQQPGKVPRIGYVSGTGDPSNPGPYVEALRQGVSCIRFNATVEARGLV